ncbi:MAG TPA: ABC transporter substrate-binding protein [Conexibacter sp.]|nr:ABC transporter substrate-binding protein [Conexibacter sp.]
MGGLGSPISRAVFLRRGVAGAVTLTGASALLAACGSSGGGSSTSAASAGGKPPARPTGSMTWGLNQKAQSLDPARAYGTETYTVNQNVYEGLTRWSEDPTDLVPALATDWSSNADATEWTFRLRDGVTFHDGTPLTSTAVKKSFEHYRDGIGSFLGSYAGEFTKIDDSDPKKVVISYRASFPDLARNAPILGIISPKALVGSGNAVSKTLEQRSYGAGAFRFDAPFSGNSFTMNAFTGYWGHGPYLETINCRVVPDESARVAALKAGDIDFMLQLGPQLQQQISGDKRFQLVSAVTWLQDRLIFACDRAPFTDQRARQAVSYALDRQLMIDRLLLGQGSVGKGLMPNGCYGYTEPSLQYTRDLAKARQLWQAAGGAGHTVTVAYGSSDPQTTVRQAETVVAMLGEAGIHAKTVVLGSAEQGEEFHGRSRKTDILVVNFGWINGGPFFYTPSVFADTQSARYTGRDVLDLQVKQNATADGPQREALLKQLQALAQERDYVLPVAEVRSSDALDASLKGYKSAKNGFMYRFDTIYRA